MLYMHLHSSFLYKKLKKKNGIQLIFVLVSVRGFDMHAKCGLVWVPHVVAYRYVFSFLNFHFMFYIFFNIVV